MLYSIEPTFKTQQEQERENVVYSTEEAEQERLRVEPEPWERYWVDLSDDWEHWAEYGDY